jgi:hypothetical protein
VPATPNPTPLATPEPTAKATPGPTPVPATPNPTPLATPEPTAKATPGPVTISNTPKPSPQPTNPSTPPPSPGPTTPNSTPPQTPGPTNPSPDALPPPVPQQTPNPTSNVTPSPEPDTTQIPTPNFTPSPEPDATPNPVPSPPPSLPPQPTPSSTIAPTETPALFESTCEAETIKLHNTGALALALQNLNEQASDLSFLKCRRSEMYPTATQCEQEVQNFLGDPNQRVYEACMAAGHKYVQLSFTAYCYPIMKDGSLDSNPALLYGETNKGSCVSSKSCNDDDLTPLFSSFIADDVKVKLEGGNFQKCDITKVMVVPTQNYNPQKEQTSSIQGISDVCKDDTMALLDDDTMEIALENLNDLASKVSLADRCKPYNGARLCELDYAKLDGGLADQAVMNSCNEMGGHYVSVSYGASCYYKWSNGTIGDLVLYYGDYNVGSCISMQCTDLESTYLYTHLINHNVNIKLESSQTQECNITYVRIGKVTSLNVDNDDSSNGTDDSEKVAKNYNGGFGSDLFAMMPTPPPIDRSTIFGSPPAPYMVATSTTEDEMEVTPADEKLPHENDIVSAGAFMIYPSWNIVTLWKSPFSYGIIGSIPFLAVILVQY